MANIQSSINQMISLAGLLASQSPSIRAGAEKKIQEKKLKAREDIVRKKREAMTGPAVLANVDTAEAESEAILQEERDIAKERYDIEPTEATYEALSKAERALHPATYTIEADPEELAREAVEAEEREQEIEYYKNLYRGFAPHSKVNDPYAELFKKYGADAYEVADTHSQDAQRRLAETRRRNREVIYGSEND